MSEPKVKTMRHHMMYRMKFSNKHGVRMGHDVIRKMTVSDRGRWYGVTIRYGPKKNATHCLSLCCSDNPRKHFSVGMTVFELAARCSAPVGLLREEEPCGVRTVSCAQCGMPIDFHGDPIGCHTSTCKRPIRGTCRPPGTCLPMMEESA